MEFSQRLYKYFSKTFAVTKSEWGRPKEKEKEREEEKKTTMFFLDERSDELSQSMVVNF